MKEIIKASLVIVDENGNSQKLKMRNSKGVLCEEIALPILDYMLSSYNNLERYFEEALKNKWITSSNVEVKIISEDGIEYDLPFGKHVETIFRCSESAAFRGGIRYIEKGNGPQMVSYKEFEEFFNEFLFNVLSEEGINLVKKDYFEKYKEFSNTLKKYQQLNEKEDDMYANSRSNSLEKGFSSCRNPKTIEDYLRDYSIFRDSLAFIRECEKERKKEKKVTKKIKGAKIVDKKKTLDQKKPAQYYANKRSLCYIIGNNSVPLILMTTTSNELDDYIIENFKDAKEIKRKYKEQIETYILENREYVTKIREQINNNKYSGQLAILEHNDKGVFRRLSNGQYLRFPVIYTSTFKGVRKLYCNIERLKKQFDDLNKSIRRKENEILVEEARLNYLNLQDKLVEVVGKLEAQKQITVDEKQKTLEEIQKIITDMQELEKHDYENFGGDNSLMPRIFSKHVSNEIRFVSATSIPKSYKIALDEWAKSLIESDYKYDHIRFILRHLRKKGNHILEKEGNVDIEITDKASSMRVIEITDEYISKSAGLEKIDSHDNQSFYRK